MGFYLIPKFSLPSGFVYLKGSSSSSSSHGGSVRSGKSRHYAPDTRSNAGLRDRSGQAERDVYAGMS